jgi:hypothetical protein
MRTALAFGTLILFPLAAFSAAASELRVSPSVALSQEVNDNIRQVPKGERLEFVTRVQPGALLDYQGPNGTAQASYNLDYRYYARHTRDHEVNHAGLLKATLKLRDEFFTLELGDSYSRVSLDLARDTVQESVLVDQTDQNLAMVSPYLTWHPGSKSLLKTGYLFRDIRYWHSSALDKQAHGAFADYQHQIAERVSFIAGYSFTHTDSELSRYQRHDLSAGLRLQYSERSHLFGSAGASWLDFSNAPGSRNPFWSVGASHDFGLLVASLESRVQYTDDPLTLATRQIDYLLKLDRELERTRLWLSAGYSSYRVELGSTPDRDRHQVTLGASHELSPGLTGGVTLLGERLSRDSVVFNLPYHLVASASLQYILAEGLTLGVLYSHISYRDDLGSSTGSIEVNRGIVELRKSF